MEGDSVRMLPRGDWPPSLPEIPDPPAELYIRGRTPDWSRTLLTVVGARKFTGYGREACEKLIAGLSGTSVTIVSGLALGIDAIAHRAALAASLPTIAVPGSGLDDRVLYPASHRGLAEMIVESGGTLLSEFPPTFRATTWSFPQRNRIMAGMSRAVLIIEAERKSGTLITARLATDYNRDVLTVPGPIFSPTASGPLYLIRLGATPVASSADILDALNLAAPSATRVRDYTDCSIDERNLLEIIEREPVPRDDLVRTLDKPAHEINALISLLEIKGLVTESNGEIHLA